MRVPSFDVANFVSAEDSRLIDASTSTRKSLGTADWTISYLDPPHDETRQTSNHEHHPSTGGWSIDNRTFAPLDRGEDVPRDSFRVTGERRGRGTRGQLGPRGLQTPGRGVASTAAGTAQA